MPFLRGPRLRPSGPFVIAAFGAALGIALGAVSIVLLRPFTPPSGSGLISVAAGGPAAGFQQAPSQPARSQPTLSMRAIAVRIGVLVGPGRAQSPAAQQQAQERSDGPKAPWTGPGAACADTQKDAGVPSAIAPAPAGALILSVLCGTGAVTAGLEPGDVITAVAGRPVTSPAALVAILDRRQPGTVVSVTWVAMTGRARTANVRLIPAPAS